LLSSIDARGIGCEHEIAGRATELELRAWISGDRKPRGEQAIGAFERDLGRRARITLTQQADELAGEDRVPLAGWGKCQLVADRRGQHGGPVHSGKVRDRVHRAPGKAAIQEHDDCSSGAAEEGTADEIVGERGVLRPA
jgi:hypothetical protein